MSIIQLVYEVHIGVCREQIFINYVWYWFSWDVFIEERVQGTTEVWINLMEINKELLNCVQLYCCTTVIKLFIVVKFTHLTYLSTRRINTSVCVSLFYVCLCVCLSISLSVCVCVCAKGRRGKRRWLNTEAIEVASLWTWKFLWCLSWWELLVFELVCFVRGILFVNFSRIQTNENGCEIKVPKKTK